MKFSELGLSEKVLRAVSDAGYTDPTPIQTQAIPVILQGRDVLGVAQTGTGKTASFTLPMIDILAAGRAKARMPRSLILTPTRELAAQISNSFETYGKYNSLSMALLIGGVSMSEQEKRLDRGVDVLIATPGRLIDLFERGKILLTGVQLLVIDEADRMLDMGFIPDVERIGKMLPSNRQTLMFSATMAKEIRRLANEFLRMPEEISVAPPASPAETVKQAMAVIDARKKRETLRALLANTDVENAIIFCNRKRDVDVLDKSLRRHGFSAAGLHGDMAQSSRTETLSAFKAGEIKLLVATDVAGRGLDIAGLSHVFNFDVPTHAEDYVHRIGRTGRAGRAGQAYMLATPSDGRYLDAIRKLIGKDIPKIDIPGVEITGEEEEEEAPAPRSRSRRTDASKSKNGTERKAKSGGKNDVEAAEPPKAQSAQKPAPETNRENRRSGKDQPVVAFGEHVPAFFKTAVPVSR
ncbi:MAG: DNA helicase [Rhodospirillaceae bacterium]|nr:DNA helicase [Rhodospirillaceae bacterium]